MLLDSYFQFWLERHEVRLMDLKARKVTDFYVVCLVEDDKDEQKACDGFEDYGDGWCRHCLDAPGGPRRREQTECNHPRRLEAPDG